MEEKKRRLPAVVKIIILLLLGVFVIGIAAVIDVDAGEFIAELLPDSLFDFFHRDKKKGNEEKTENDL